jgi:uncharacterized iron-regulated membrane protein
MKTAASGAKPRPGFRAAMDPLHASSGVLFGALLFAIFLMGTLAVFDREIDRWAQPHTRMAPPAANDASLDAALPHLHALSPQKTAFWLIYPPSDRVPTLRLSWPAEGAVRAVRDLDPVTGAALPQQGAPLGTRLFFPFHYSLHLKWLDLGEWIVGLAAMVMLVTIVSGVATHRRIFKDLLAFRAGRSLQRSALDLHNLGGVLALPFHFVIALSGLIIFSAVYLQPAIGWLYDGQRAAYTNEALSRYTRTPARQPATQPMASLDALAARARSHWAAAGEPGEVQLVIVRHPGDARAVVEIRRTYGQRVGLEAGTLYFDATSGELLHAERLPAASRVQRFIAGMHLVQFDHWTLRWLYFLMGLAGCVTIATGSIVWVQKRAERHARLGRGGAAWVEALNVASIAGLLAATVGVMLLNALPPAWWSGGDALHTSMRWFFGLWGMSALHATALRRSRRHWEQQSSAIAAVAAAAALASSLGSNNAWTNPAAMGVNVALVLASVMAAHAAWRLRRARHDHLRHAGGPVTCAAAGNAA